MYRVTRYAAASGEPVNAPDRKEQFVRVTSVPAKRLKTRQRIVAMPQAVDAMPGLHLPAMASRGRALV